MYIVRRPPLGLQVLVLSGMVACGSANGGGTETPGPPPAGEVEAGAPLDDASSEAASPDAGADAATDADVGVDAAADDAATDGAVLLDAGTDAATNDDPFDPASCGGPVLTSADALAMLGAAPKTKLADATLLRRTRACAGATADTCGAWGAPAPHTQALLTYSGGVVTDYKTFAFPTHLVLFTASGAPKLSIRHTSDYLHSEATSTRGVVFAFGADPMVNTYPVIYVWDFAPAPNRYDDLQGLLGNRGELHAREHCARVVFTSGITTEIAALYRY